MLFCSFIEDHKLITMKKISLFLTGIVFLTACVEPQANSTSKFRTPGEGNFIEWLGSNPMANELALIGMRHFMNAEQEKAYAFFEAAVSYDSTMFAPHVCLAEMSADGSEKQEYHIAEAKKNVANKNETSKVFVSLLDQEPDGFWGYFDSSKAHSLWEKMHIMEPKGYFIQQFYVHTMKDTDRSIETINTFIAQAKSNNDPYENLLNLLGYKLMSKGDMKGAQKAFSDYIEAYSSGYNAYDSMGEYHLKNDNKDSGMEYYSKAIENYPFASNAKRVLSQMK